ncbi:hypothetical protein MKJ04_21900 [Pontibacter sp. E15-1]|uniref:hypothetical protein n=1 Tax=Pontibacter sp. E15-1 TaxID=2919918 RepID=UPI001F4FB325|nr:hypothetical protein [Pontibacter sp. E15-1]MCJ8167511.1 hypothetical protein [Pontibacter sp. E15-1]
MVHKKKIKIRDAWDKTRCSNCASAAILDSGVDWMSPDLGAGTVNNGYKNTWLNPDENWWTDPNNPATGNGLDDGNGFGLVDD